MEGAEPSSFPGPLRIGGYARWSWHLFRAWFPRYVLVFMGGVALVETIHFLLVVAVSELTSGRTGAVATLATSLASGVTLATLTGGILAALAAISYVAHVSGVTVRPGDAWRRLRPLRAAVLVAGLYVSMPLVMILFVVGPSIEILLRVMILPALLGPPVLVHAIAWEGLDFREAATRAKNMLAGSWGRVVSALLLLSLGAALVQILTLMLAGSLIGGAEADEPLEYAVVLVLKVATTATVWLFATAAGAVAYLELRSRFESLDRPGLTAEAEALHAV